MKCVNGRLKAHGKWKKAYIRTGDGTDGKRRMISLMHSVT
jgi:hypothetical protein